MTTTNGPMTTSTITPAIAREVQRISQLNHDQLVAEVAQMAASWASEVDPMLGDDGVSGVPAIAQAYRARLVALSPAPISHTAAPTTLTYKGARVDIDAGAALVKRIAPMATSTLRTEVLGDIGGFAALCKIPAGYTDPVLVSGTDGVGTKLKTALATGRHQTIGIDLVAMCVNDVLVTGAEPLFFLDYFATGSLDVDVATSVVSGIALGCRVAGCSLIGGETAELPGLYHGHDYDLAGFCVGVVERTQIRPRPDLTAGDLVIGLPSSGLHANGYSLARKVILEVLGLSLDTTLAELGGATIADEFLRPTIIYADAFAALRHAGLPWKAAAHITGGWLIENPPRIFADDTLSIELDTARWDVPPIMSVIHRAGVPLREMYRTFNMGLGMIFAVPADIAGDCVTTLGPWGGRVVGKIVPRADGVPSRLIGPGFARA